MAATRKQRSRRAAQAPRHKATKAARQSRTKERSPHEHLLNLIHGFLNDVGCAQDMFVTVVPALRNQDRRLVAKANRNIERLHRDAKKEGTIRTELVRRVRAEAVALSKLGRPEQMFTGNALVGLVSRYDEFLASILKNVFCKNPGRATAPDKSVTYDEILTLSSIKGVAELFVAKEIDGLLRESHRAQLEALDREFKMGVVDGFSEIRQLVEITERRNVLVHSGGKVSRLYRKKCREVGCEKDAIPAEGTQLRVSEEYFRASVLCLSELAVRLGYALAFRVYPGKVEETHSHILDEVGFSMLLMSEEWELAKRLFSFALSTPDKYADTERTTRLYVVNLALTYNQLRQHDAATKLLDEYDWSVSGPEFRLAEAVLRRNWDTAERLMSGMTGQARFDEDQFRTWPVFKEFRNTKQFRRAFKVVFGKRFVTRLSKEESDAIQKAAKTVS